MYSAREPIAGGDAEYTQRENYLRGGRTSSPPARWCTNRRRGGGMYSAREPIAGGEAEYTQREN
eukprot:7420908-Pyramimonas_sp.AAC.1